MKVYQSRRTCALPEYVYAAMKYNAANAALSADGDGIIELHGRACRSPSSTTRWN